MLKVLRLLSSIYCLVSSSQKGFSSLGLFLMVLTMLIIMSSIGFFTPPKSEVDDKNVYQPSESGQANSSTLQFTDLKFHTPTPTPTKEPTPTSIPPTQGPTEIPTPTPFRLTLPTNTPGPPIPTQIPPPPQPPTATPIDFQ